MKEALYISDKSCVFRWTANSSSDTARLRGTPTDITYLNGVASFNGSTSKIVVAGTYRLNSIRIKVRSLASTTQNIIKLSSTHSISISSGTISATGFSSPTIYVNGAVSSTIGTSGGEIVVTTATTFNANTIVIGNITTYLNGSLELISIYNRVLSMSEITNLYNNRAFKKLPQTSTNYTTLLDFDATQGYITDRSSFKRTLTPTPGLGGIRRIGNIYGYYFDGADSKIDCGTFSLLGDITLSCWVNLSGWGENNLGRILDSAGVNIVTNIISNVIALSRNNGSIFATGATNSLKLGTWIHILVTSTSTGVTNFYINNTLSGTANQSAGTPIANSNVILGNNAASTRTLRGILPKLSVYQGILSTEQISQIYSSERNIFGV